jgi:uncharacterized protein
VSRVRLSRRADPAEPVRRGAGPRRRRWVAAGSALAGTGLLGASLTAEPGSPRFYRQTFGVAGIWLGGGLASGPVPLAGEGAPRQVLVPVVLGAATFGVFYGGALVARHVPVLNRAIGRILRYAHGGAGPLVLATTLATGAAEEVMFRGAGYAALGERHPVLWSTAAYTLATTATRNPALVLAAGVMGTLFGLQRRATGGVQASILTHLTWSGLMLRFLPPLFAAPE